MIWAVLRSLVPGHEKLVFAFALGLLGVIFIGGAYFVGRIDAARACNSRALEAQIATLQRDLAISKISEEIANSYAQDLLKKSESDAKTLEEFRQYIEALLVPQPPARPDAPPAPPNRCLLSPADADRLRQLGN